MVEAAKRISTRVAGPRLIALVGPFQSGKTTLLESHSRRARALSRGQARCATASTRRRRQRRGARPRHERRGQCRDAPNISATAITFVDCPGSIEFLHEMRDVLPVCDAAVVVCEADERKMPALQLDPARTRGSRHSALPVPQQDRHRHAARARDARACCSRPRARRCCCARSRSGRTASRSASSTSRSSAPSSIASMRRQRGHRHARRRSARARRRRAISMLERLADYDDALMEELISDIEPPRDQVFDDLAQRTARRPSSCRC